jgi:hypothetical protein
MPRDSSDPPSGRISRPLSSVPLPVGIAAAVLLVEAGSRLWGHSAEMVTLQFGVALVFTALLLLGSRVVWTLTVTGLLIQAVLVPFLDQSWHILAVTAIALLLLLTGPSRRYFWKEQRVRRARYEFGAAVGALYERAVTAGFLLASRLARWEADPMEEASRWTMQSYRLVLWRLGWACVLLLVLIGTIRTSGDGLLVDVVVGTAWVCYMCAQIGFLAALCLAGIASVAKRRQRSVAITRPEKR